MKRAPQGAGAALQRSRYVVAVQRSSSGVNVRHSATGERTGHDAVTRIKTGSSVIGGQNSDRTVKTKNSST